MFPTINDYINNSIAILSNFETDERNADECIRFLKSNTVNQLSAHEFTHWLDRSKVYLERGMRIEKKGELIEALLKAELIFRKNQTHMPIFVSYGEICHGILVKQPEIRLLPMYRIGHNIISAKGKGLWNDNEDVAKIVSLKTETSKYWEEYTCNPYVYARRCLNAPKREFYQIESGDEADLLTQYLNALPTIFWKEDIHCETRSRIACEYLDGFSIDPETLFYARVGKTTQFDKITEANELFDRYQWAYHQAVAIKTTSNEFFILDPATDPMKALKPETWASVYGKKLTIRYTPAAMRDWKESNCAGRYGDPEMDFAVASGARLPNIGEITSTAPPKIQEILSIFSKQT